MKDNKGLTLIELVVALGIMGVIFLITSSFVLLSTTSHNLTVDEASIQSDMRLLSTDINHSIRNASATFSLYKEDDSKLTEKWNYIMVDPVNQNSVSKYEWDDVAKKHNKSYILEEVPGTTFRLEYQKKGSYGDNSDSLIGFNIIASVDGEERVIESGLESLNSLQVIDRRSAKGLSNTIAYRFDPKPSAVAESQAAISMVLDTSGSMSLSMGGGSTSYTNSRMYLLIQESVRLVESLADNPNIHVSLNPFEWHGNDSQPMMRANDSDLIEDIKAMRASGNTNTGDGMRRGFHRIKEFNEKELEKDSDDQMNTKNFMIVLIDGATNRGTAHQRNPRKWVEGNGNVDNYWLSADNTYRPVGRVTPDSKAYVEHIGEMITNYRSPSPFNENIETYVIGFSANSGDLRLLDHHADALNSKEVYKAGDDKALKEIFAKIKKDIDDSLWQIGGPQ